jgi:hypothetical protein
MKEKARDLVYLNTKRYFSFADLKTFQRIGLVISFCLFALGFIEIKTNGVNWKSLFPIVSGAIWDVLYWKFVSEIKSRKTTFEMRFLVNGIWGIFMMSLIWAFFTSFNLAGETPIVDYGFCLWVVLLYLIFSVIYMGLIILGVHKGAFKKVRKFSSSAKVLALDAVLASLIPIAGVLGRIDAKLLKENASVSTQNVAITVSFVVLIFIFALGNINFVQYYYCKKYDILHDENGNATSPKLETY